MSFTSKQTSMDSHDYAIEDGVLPVTRESSLLLRRIADLEHRLYEKDLDGDNAGAAPRLLTSRSPEPLLDATAIASARAAGINRAPQQINPFRSLQNREAAWSRGSASSCSDLLRTSPCSFPWGELVGSLLSSLRGDCHGCVRLC